MAELDNGSAGSLISHAHSGSDIVGVNIRSRGRGFGSRAHVSLLCLSANPALTSMGLWARRPKRTRIACSESETVAVASTRFRKRSGAGGLLAVSDAVCKQSMEAACHDSELRVGLYAGPRRRRRCFAPEEQTRPPPHLASGRQPDPRPSVYRRARLSRGTPARRLAPARSAVGRTSCPPPRPRKSPAEPE